MSEREPGQKIRVLLLAGQALFRASLGRFLAGEPGLQLIAECASPAEALEALGKSEVDVILVDYDDSPHLRDGFLPSALQQGPDRRCLVIASSVDLGNTAAAIRQGASGIFMKSDAPERLVLAIGMVAGGAVWLDQGIVRQWADQSVDRFHHSDDRGAVHSLTEREQQVLQGIVSGLTNKRIGENLGLSEGSVKTAVQQLFQRAGVRRRSQLVRASLEGTLGHQKTSAGY